MEVAARAVGPDDLPLVAELFAAALEALGPVRGGRLYLLREARRDVGAEALGAWFDRETTTGYVGTIDDVVLGAAAAHREVLDDGSQLAVLDELYVDPGARGVGVGEAMMDAVVAWAEAAGCAGIDALALPGDRETKNFFETFGLTARAIVVHRALGGP